MMAITQAMITFWFFNKNDSELLSTAASCAAVAFSFLFAMSIIVFVFLFAGVVLPMIADTDMPVAGKYTT